MHTTDAIAADGARGPTASAADGAVGIAASAADGAMRLREGVGTAASAADGAVRLRGGTMAADGEMRLPADDGAVGLRGRSGLERPGTGMGSGLSSRARKVILLSNAWKSFSSNDTDTPNVISAVTLSKLDLLRCK